MTDKIYTGTDVKNKKDIEDIFVRTIKSANRKIKQTNKSDENYNFTHPYRGLAVIISNEHFKRLAQRDYSTEEILSMRRALTRLEFTTMVFQDLTVQQINWVMDIAAGQHIFHKKSDCFACVIASHGEEKPRASSQTHDPKFYYRDHCIYGANGVTVPTNSLIDTIAECEGLGDKPKIFLIQACRSRTDVPRDIAIDHGYELNINFTYKSECDLKSGSSGTIDELDQEDRDFKECPENDNTEDGSRFGTEDFNNKEEPISVSSSKQNYNITCSDFDINVEKSQSIKNQSAKTNNKGPESPLETNMEQKVVSKGFLLDHDMCPKCDKKTAKTNTDGAENLLDASRKDTIESKGFLSKLFRRDDKDSLPSEVIRTLYPPCQEDCVIVYSSSSGRESYGRCLMGGWMLHAVSTVIQNSIYETEDIELIAIVTEANRLISGKMQTNLPEGTEHPYRKSVAVIEHRLYRNVKF